MPFNAQGLFSIVNNLVRQYLAGQKKANPEPIDQNFEDVAQGLTEVRTLVKTAQGTADAAAPGTFGLGTLSRSITNWNTEAIANGWYQSLRVPQAQSNAPAGENALWIGYTVCHNAEHAYQVVINWDSGDMYKRRFSVGAPGAWVRLIDANSVPSLRVAFASTADFATQAHLLGSINSNRYGVALDRYCIFGNDDARRIVGLSDWVNALYPWNSDNFLALGDNRYRWAALYAASGSIITSDAREKNLVNADGTIPEAVLRAWARVDFVQYQMRDAVADKGAQVARLHTGLIAQRVREAFAAEGLDAFRYGLLCRDVWEAQEAITNAEGHEIVPAHEAGERFALRYDEALCLEAAFQRQRVATLEARVARLEARVARLEARE